MTEMICMHGMLLDVFGMANLESEMDNPPNEHDEEPNIEAKKFYKLVDDDDHELCNSCKDFRKLTFFTHLLNMKCMEGCSNSTPLTESFFMVSTDFPLGMVVPFMRKND